jgi:hypothetical protein
MKKLAVLHFLFFCVTAIFANTKPNPKDKLITVNAVFKNATNKPLTYGSYIDAHSKKRVVVTSQDAFTITTTNSKKTVLAFMADGYAVYVLKPARYTKKKNRLTLIKWGLSKKFM